MSDWDSYSDDPEDDDEVDSEFDDNGFRATAHTEYDTRMMVSAQDAKERISSVTTDEFLQEAYVEATNLRNLLGDADGNAFDRAENIRTNILVAMHAIKKEPVEFVIAAASTTNDKVAFVQSVIRDLQAFLDTDTGSATDDSSTSHAKA